MDEMETNLDFYSVVLGKNKYPDFSEKYRQAIISYIFDGVSVKKLKAKRIEIEFSTSGLIGVNKYWLNHINEYTKQDILGIS